MDERHTAPPPGPALRITSPGQKPHFVSLRADRMSIGRAAGCDIMLADKLVSSRHAELYPSGGAYRVRDLGSTNGLYVNGVRRTEGHLRSGDRVRIGDSVLEVLLPEGERAAAQSEAIATDRTVIDPFSIKLSLDDVAAGLSEPPTVGPGTAELVLQKLRLLYRLGQDVNQIEDVQVWFERVARLIRETLGPERVAIVTASDHGGMAGIDSYQCALAVDWTHAPDVACASDVASAPVYVPRAFLAQIFEEQKAILYQNVDFEPRFSRDPEIARAPIHMMMAAPLISQRGVLGILYLDRGRPQPIFSPDDLHLLGVIANQCAVMLDNARLLAEARRALDDLKATQEQLIHAARLTSLGELVAGIAHEINNPLAAVLGFAELLLEQSEMPPGAHGDVKRIVEQATRVKRIVEKLLIFARRKSTVLEPLDVNELVSTALEFKAYDFRAHHVRVETELAPDLPRIRGNRTDLEQVLTNILHNADQAVAPRGAGRVHAITRRVAPAGVEISIEDDGPGIAAEHLSKVFDPFFTTKPVGVGTGLGLSISHGIVLRHDATIVAENAPAGGAVFRLRFPALPSGDGAGAAAAPPSEATPSSVPALPAAVTKRTKVLIVDDEEAIRDAAATYLTRRGMQVTLAANAQEARDALKSGESYDVVVVDLRFPETSGVEIYGEACRIDPSLVGRVIFITGDVANQDCALLEQRFPDSVLAKPFDLSELDRRVRRIAGA